MPSFSKKFRFESHALNNVCDAKFEDKVRGHDLIKVKNIEGVGGWVEVVVVVIVAKWTT